MSQKSDYLEQIMINAALKATAFTGAATLYMSLHTANPTDAGGSEVSGNAYARTAIAFGTASGGSNSNSGAVTFPAPTPSNWGTVTHFAIFDAATVGNMYYYGALTNSIATSVGVPVSFPVGSVVIAET